MLKTRLSLNQTWTKCMAMWKEMIEKYWKRGMRGDELKRVYFENHPKAIRPFAQCYFCDITQPNRNRRTPVNCRKCPGILVSKDFYCMNESYHYHRNPKAFYRKLVELDKKRKKAKGQ